MPKPDKYGSQAPLEVIREFLSYGGFYNSEHLQWKEVCNVTLLASCTVSGQPQHNSNIDRITPKFK